ncbi:MAG: YihY/virulence factor BrkB family protein [Alsobacter sp.]
MSTPPWFRPAPPRAPDGRSRPILAILGAVGAAALAGGVGFVVGVARGAALDPGDAGFARSSPDETNPGAALDRSRGRMADSPAEIPAKGWKDIVRRTWGEIGKDRVTSIAAGVTYYAILALFPAVAAAVAIYGLFTDPMTITRHFEQVRDILPYGAADIIGGQLRSVSAKGDGTLGITFAIGLVASLWSANAGAKALLDALNIAYDETEERSLLKLNAVALAFTLGGILFVIAALAAFLGVPLALSYLPLGPAATWAILIGRWVAMAVLVALGLAVLYRYGPDRREPRWRWITVGSAAASVGWLVASAALSVYATRFAHYDATYGSLGGIIGLMVWIWVSAIVILVGAELNAEVEHQTARDSTVGRRKPLGTRNATMADTIGQAAE